MVVMVEVMVVMVITAKTHQIYTWKRCYVSHLKSPRFLSFFIGKNIFKASTLKKTCFCLLVNYINDYLIFSIVFLIKFEQ